MYSSFNCRQYKPYDLVFADPPYDLENIAEIHKHVMANNLLKEGGCG